MIFKNKYYKEWHKKFAWFPENINGETVWLRSYYMRYVTSDEYGCERCKHFSGWWELKKSQ